MSVLCAVVPTLNEAERVASLVHHLRGLGVDEVLVVDGGSGDGTVGLARGAGARVVHAPRGRASQLNRGAWLSQSEILWFVHADVRPPAGAPRLLRAALQDADVVAGAFRIKTVNDGGVPSVVDPWLALANLRAGYTSLPYGDQALFVRRDAFEAVGGYPLVPLFEDLGLARRLRRVGRLRVLPACVEVSARRFVARPLRSALAMHALPLAWRLGVPPDVLARWYPTVR